jgi:MFS family permease
MSVLTFLTPIMSALGIYYLFIVRILIGAFAGISFPSTNAIYGKWSPPTERSRMGRQCISILQKLHKNISLFQQVMVLPDPIRAQF